MRHLFCFVSFLITCPLALLAQERKILPDSEITFAVENLKINTVRGSVGGLDGEVRFDPQDISSAFINITADPATISTGIAKRDKHLQEEEFFHTASFPEIKVSTDLIDLAAAQGRFHFSGTLTIKGISREINCGFSAVEDTGVWILEGSFEIMRSDFDLGAEHSTFIIGEAVQVSVKLVLGQ